MHVYWFFSFKFYILLKTKKASIKFINLHSHIIRKYAIAVIKLFKYAHWIDQELLSLHSKYIRIINSRIEFTNIKSVDTVNFSIFKKIVKQGHCISLEFKTKKRRINLIKLRFYIFRKYATAIFQFPNYAHWIIQKLLNLHCSYTQIIIS